MANDQDVEMREQIQSVGLRCTAGRLAVLRELTNAHAPLSHAELTDRLHRTGVDQATVFRNLNDLADAGLLVRAELGDHVWRFEVRDSRSGPDGVHPHFVCVDCGAISCVAEVQLTTTSQRRTRKLGRVTEVLLKGHCTDCETSH